MANLRDQILSDLDLGLGPVRRLKAKSTNGKPSGKSRKEKRGRKRNHKNNIDNPSWSQSEAWITPDREGLNFFATTRMHDYLQCEVPHWKYPEKSTDKVELEPIPSPMFSSFHIKPMIFEVELDGKLQDIQRVCGFREIYQKRNHIKYLKDQEDEDAYILLSPENEIQPDFSEKVLNSAIRERFKYLAPGGEHHHHGHHGEGGGEEGGHHHHHHHHGEGEEGGNEAAFDITNFESYYEYVYGVPVLDLPQRDRKWLQLSDTDEAEESKKIDSLDKKLPPSMLTGIRYESQSLVRSLWFLHLMCRLTGRQFYYTTPNFTKGHMEFAWTRTRQLLFFITAFTLWAALVLMSQSLVSIRFTTATAANETTGQEGAQKKRVQTPEDQNLLVEQLELNKYQITCYFVLVYLTFVAVWSILVILRDGQLITHYLNCWVAALAEMETSGTVGIQRTVCNNILVWMVASAILGIGFWKNFPGNVRGTSGMISILLFRSLFESIRLSDEERLFLFQLIGFSLVLYIFFCARMLFTLMQVIALIVKNAAEMWNFKFALTFNQLTMTNRGVIKRLSINLPLLQFFLHHRIMSALVKMYGKIFAVPIMIYLVTQMALVTYVLVQLFNYKAGTIEDYDGTDSAAYEYYPRVANAQKTLTILIPFYHRPIEEISTRLFVLMFLIFDFVYTTEVLGNATRSFLDGFEFVRRTNLVLCKTSHQRRLIQSLLWSMSDTEPTLISAGGFFPVGRTTIFAGIATVIAYFSLIIQLQQVAAVFKFNFVSCADQTKGGDPDQVEERCKPNTI